MRRLLIAIAAIAITAGVFVYLTVSAPRREVPAVPARTEAPRAPVVRETPPVAEVPRPPARRAPAPRAEPEPVPAPVDAAPTVGTLRIDADIAGAQVFIDRNFVGVTPMTVENIEPGPHQLNVSTPGYDGISEPIEVVPGPRDITIKFKEVRLSVSLDVVHKHRFGSCKGRLIATPQGIRYEPTEQGDELAGALLDIQTFEVDYLAKNLRVQLRNGKRYDFTDPQGNADHLFVFHRDVEKARERLKKGDAPAVD